MEDRLTRQALAAFLDRFSPTAQALAEAVRNRLFDIFPDALETAEGKELGYGFDRGYKGLVFTISLKKEGANLGIVGGASLDDPDRLLCGSGKVHRHIAILDANLLDDPRVTRLLRKALNARRGTHPVNPPRT